MTEMTPAALSGDVPAEKWRRDLEALAEVPSRERHAQLGELLDELDAQVGSL
ncbi:hypothetical protein [Brevibacterium sp.]|uniref:hypothetical protein n=1 Tax=Brevibacterium sp. TaxID=1701 RepID=UPI0028121D48|nr:hypothetical protein [Brevibacterium sp.]